MTDQLNAHFTSETDHARAQCCVKYLIMYLHIIAFEKFVLECACEAIKPVKPRDIIKSGCSDQKQ